MDDQTSSAELRACPGCGHAFATCTPRLCPACGYAVMTQPEYDERENVPLPATAAPPPCPHCGRAVEQERDHFDGFVREWGCTLPALTTEPAAPVQSTD